MSSRPATEYAGVPLLEVRVMTNNLLSANTTEEVLNKLDVIQHIRQINMSGESLPKSIGNGPAKGLPNNHTERKLIHVGEREVELQCMVGAFYMELEVDDEKLLDSVVAEIKTACDATLANGYSLTIGRYSKYRKSLTDYRGS
jgi:methyl-coenzyme M reductase subunit D